MLFAGDKGIGKRLTAITFAKAINCMQHSNKQPDSLSMDCCNVCPSCRKISKSTHPDLYFTHPDGEYIKVDQIREIQSNACLSPLESSKKVFIIETADKMNIQAANCFLKTLEEPPSDNIFILLSNIPDRLLPTISSRCQSIRFFPIRQKDVIEVLVDEGIDIKEAGKLSKLAAGSPGTALEMFKGDVAGISREANDLLTGKTLQDMGFLFSTAEKFSKSTELFEKLLSWLQIAIRDMLVYQKTSRIDLSISYPDIPGATNHDRDELIDLFMLIETYRTKSVYNINKQLVIEDILFKIAGLSKTHTPATEEAYTR